MGMPSSTRVTEVNVLVGKPEENILLRWEDNIKEDLKGLWWESVDLINLAQDTDQ
jgi:hypothetical protein